MRIIHWLNAFILGANKIPKNGEHRRPRSCRLQVEMLEDRVVLSTVTGFYSLGPGTDGNQAVKNNNGTFHLVATQAGAFSYVDYFPNQIFTFGQLNTLSAAFTSVSGGAAGGSLRIKVGLDDNGVEKFILIYVGTATDYIDTSASLNTYSGVNLINNSSPDAFDTSAIAGGSLYTTYANADALIGSMQVVEYDFVVDTFSPYANRNITFNSFTATFNDALPFQDNFNTGSTLSDSWFQEAGNYVTTSGQAVGQPGFNLAVANGINVSDVSVQALMNFTAARQYIGLVARYSGPGDNNEYIGNMSWLGGINYTAAIYKISGGTVTLLTSVKLTTNVSGTLRFDLEGPSLKLFVNGGLVAYAQDFSNFTGTVGIRSSGGAGVDDFSATAITEPATPDTFSDNFNANPPGNQLSTNWLEQAGNYNVASGAAVAQAGFNLATLTNLAASNLSVQADFNFTANSQYVGLVARYSGPRDNNEYIGNISRLSPTNYQAAIFRIVNGKATLLASQTLTAAAGTLVFEVAGPSLKLFVNNTLVAYAHDMALTSGSAGMRTSRGTSVDNFAINPIDLTPAPRPFSDTFNTSVNNQLSSYWLEQAGNFKVTPGTGAVGQAALNVAVLNGLSVADVTLEANISLALSSSFGLLGRYTGPGDTNAYLANVSRLANGTYQANFYKYVAGAWMKVGATATLTTFAGDLKFILSGTALTLEMDGVTVLSITDSSITGAATVGMRSSAGVTVSSFSAS